MCEFKKQTEITTPEPENPEVFCIKIDEPIFYDRFVKGILCENCVPLILPHMENALRKIISFHGIGTAQNNLLPSETCEFCHTKIVFTTPHNKCIICVQTYGITAVRNEISTQSGFIYHQDYVSILPTQRKQILISNNNSTQFFHS